MTSSCRMSRLLRGSGVTVVPRKMFVGNVVWMDTDHWRVRVESKTD
jgi:hypothetical protein